MAAVLVSGRAAEKQILKIKDLWSVICLSLLTKSESTRKLLHCGSCQFSIGISQIASCLDPFLPVQLHADSGLLIIFFFYKTVSWRECERFFLLFEGDPLVYLPRQLLGQRVSCWNIYIQKQSCSFPRTLIFNHSTKAEADVLFVIDFLSERVQIDLVLFVLQGLFLYSRIAGVSPQVHSCGFSPSGP